jgi:hypothetical protein
MASPSGPTETGAGAPKQAARTEDELKCLRFVASGQRLREQANSRERRIKWD